jgi:hypothetical protein
MFFRKKYKFPALADGGKKCVRVKLALFLMNCAV